MDSMAVCSRTINELLHQPSLPSAASLTHRSWITWKLRISFLCPAWVMLSWALTETHPSPSLQFPFTRLRFMLRRHQLAFSTKILSWCKQDGFSPCHTFEPKEAIISFHLGGSFQSWTKEKHYTFLRILTYTTTMSWARHQFSRLSDADTAL